MSFARYARFVAVIFLVGALSACVVKPPPSDVPTDTPGAPGQPTRFDDGKAAFDHSDIWRVGLGPVSVEGFQSYFLRLDRVPPGLPRGESYLASACYLTLDRIHYIASTKGNVQTLVDFARNATPTARTGGARLNQISMSPTDTGEEVARFEGQIETDDRHSRIQSTLVELNFSSTGFPYFLRCEGPTPMMEEFQAFAADLSRSFVAPTER